MAEDLGEKTEDATPKRLQEAREEGRVPKSGDFAGALLLLGVTLALAFGLMPLLGKLKVYMEQTLGVARAEDLVDESVARGLGIEAIAKTALLGLPLLVIAWLAGYLAHFGQVGWMFTPKSLQPQLSKLNPISGFGRIFGISGVVKAGMDVSKVGLVLVVAVVTISGMIDTIVQLPNLEMLQALGKVGWLMFDLSIRIIAVLIVLGVLDLAWQRWKFKQDLRMTKTEVKEEMKQTEGDPETRKRRHRMQQQIAAQRVRAAVPQADVIVTNPEHISVAIKYDEETMRAPRVIAKGADHLALRIRQIALSHGIPIVERKPLARALYRDVAVGQEVPPDFYQAVAEILAYVFRLNGRIAGERVTS